MLKGKDQLIEDKIRNILTVECYNLKYDRKKCRKAYVNDDLINEVSTLLSPAYSH